MSKAHLEGRQAENNTERPDSFVLGGFEEDGREVIKKRFSSGKAAEKPDFFMGGCDPTVPKGPKRKLRKSWLADDPKKEDEKPSYVEHKPKPLKKWTPVPKKQIPPRCKSHDGTMATGPLTAVRKGRRASVGNKEEKKEEIPPVAEEPAMEEAAAVASRSSSPKGKIPSASASRSASPKKKPEEPKPEPEPEPEPTPAPVVTPPAPVVAPVAAPVVAPTPAVTPTKTTTPTATTSNDEKDAEIAALKAEIEKLRAEKGELARTLKKSKGSLEVNKQLKQELEELKTELRHTRGDDSHHVKAIHKLEKKLNTLKMMMDGTVNRNSLEDLQDHVNMLNMILYQDLKQEGMKNVWV